MENPRTFTAFAGHSLLRSGPVAEVVRALRDRLDRDAAATLLVFEDRTGVQVDFDLRGTGDECVARLAHHPLLAAVPAGGPRRAGPGRPRLGVVAREVTLLPRHWDWLETQPGGASAALRRLVDEARKSAPGTDAARAACEAAGRFLTAMAGNYPGYEEATRALFALDREGVSRHTADWPADVRAYLLRLLSPAFAD